MKYSLSNQIIPSEGLGQKMEKMGEECCSSYRENVGSFNVPPLYEEKECSKILCGLYRKYKSKSILE